MEQRTALPAPSPPAPPPAVPMTAAPPDQSTGKDAGSWRVLTPQFIASLPTDPQQLYQAIRAESVTAMEKKNAATHGGPSRSTTCRRRTSRPRRWPA
jgi:hypothetical protein